MSEVRRWDYNLDPHIVRRGIGTTVAALTLFAGCSPGITFKTKEAPNVTCLALKDGATFRKTPHVHTAEEGGRDANRIIELDLDDTGKIEAFVSVSNAEQYKDNNGKWIGVSALEASAAFENSNDLTSIAPGQVWVAVNAGRARIAKDKECKKWAPNYLKPASKP